MGDDYLDISNITDTIIQTINTIFGNLFSSIDNNIYSVLDEITFVNTDILKTTHFENIFGSSIDSGFLLIANAFIIGFVLYYAIKLILSNFFFSQVQPPYQFLLKIIILAIFMNSSFFICEQIINIISLMSSSVRGLGEELFGVSICFSSLVEKLNTVIYLENSNLNIFSIDGIIKSFISFGFFNLIFSYSVRYIMLKVFILISPFAILSYSTSPSFLKAWVKCFLSLLLVQILVSIVLLILFAIDFNSSNLFSKFIFVGAIFSLIKANSYVRDVMGGISTDIQTGMTGLKNMMI